MKHWSMQKKLTAVVLCCVLLPLLTISTVLLENWKKQEVDNKSDELLSHNMELQIQVDRAVELCTVTTQVFLQDSNLKNYLKDLQAQTPIANENMYTFSKNDISFMERIVASNPYIDHVRIYSTEQNIQELFPVLFGQERLRDIGWNAYLPGEKCWYLDYTDQLFSAQNPHLMGLLSPIRDGDNGMLGAIEVSISMNKIFPNLYEGEGNALLISESGEQYGRQELAEQLKSQEIAEGESVVWQTNLDGKPVLATAVNFPALHTTYYEIEDLTEMYHMVLQVQIFASLVVTASIVALWIMVRVLMKRMLRQLYLVLDGVNQFVQGDTNTVIPIVAQDEIGAFTTQVNLMLGRIRDYIHQQINQEMLIKNTQIKALQNQINAHFIHNVLENIKMMAIIEEKPEIAASITSLSKLLRYTMGWRHPMVALKDELDYVKNYVDLLNLRFDGQVTVVCHIAPELMMQILPKVSLQPLVENAIVHGDTDFEQRKVFITATQYGRDMHISITTDGPPPDKIDLERMQASIEGKLFSNSNSGNGIGLHNIQERIHQNFGEQYGLVALDGITLTLPRRDWEGAENIYGNSPDCRR